MIPYKLLFNVGSKAVGSYFNRKKERDIARQQAAIEEIRNGGERARRKGSLFLDLILGSFILAPLGILAYATYWGDPEMIEKTKFYFDLLKSIPEAYLWLIFIVVGGNYGISVTNLLTGKKFK
jgi:hypothetical protein